MQQCGKYKYIISLKRDLQSFFFTILLSSAVPVSDQKEQLVIFVHQDVALSMVERFRKKPTHGSGFVHLFRINLFGRNVWSTLYKVAKDNWKHILLIPRQEF